MVRKNFQVNGFLYKKFILIATIFLFCLLYASVRFKSTDYYYFHNLSTTYNTEIKTTKYVLYWSPFWKFSDYHLGIGFRPFRNCKYKNCFATDNRSLIPLEQFDALLFHASTYDKRKHGVPQVRHSHQRYIFVNVEAPVYITPNLKQYSSYFNWTMTYRYDSDIIRRHGYFFKEDVNYTLPNKNILKNKTRIAAWFASNCHTGSLREILSKAIQKQMEVDVYGSCGTLQCTRKKGDPKLSDPSCYSMVERRYKFYFAFENSYCKDYSTEKLYNILAKNIVPVVYGGGNYSDSAPPNSVINVADFDNVTHLVEYLKYLHEHDEEYLKYFEWKKHYRILQSLQPSACQLCQKLNENVGESFYRSLDSWWWGKDRQLCKVGRDLPKIVSDLLE